MTTDSMERSYRRASAARARWEPDFRTVLCAAVVLGAVTAFCEDATLRLVVWAFLG